MIAEVDADVKRLLHAWSTERDANLARDHLRREFPRLNPKKRRQIVDRLAEIALGRLHVLLRIASPR